MKKREVLFTGLAEEDLDHIEAVIAAGGPFSEIILLNTIGQAVDSRNRVSKQNLKFQLNGYTS
jgi:hypothetical protein